MSLGYELDRRQVVGEMVCAGEIKEVKHRHSGNVVEDHKAEDEFKLEYEPMTAENFDLDIASREHDQKLGIPDSVDGLLRREHFNEEHGLNVIINPNGNGVRKLIAQSHYDVRGTGYGDIPLPASERRTLDMGELETCNRGVLDLVY